MNDNAKWRVARLDDLERRGRFIPVREPLGIHSFGINAVTLGEDGTLINEHDESGSRQEEVYVVLDGTATFEIDGQTFDAPAGTFVSVPPTSRRKATGDATVLALGGTPGEAYQALDWGEAWSIHNDSMTAYGEQRTATRSRRCAVVSSASRTTPASTTTAHALRRSPARSTTRHSVISGGQAESFPPFREQARADDDFAAIRDDPRFEEALR